MQNCLIDSFIQNSRNLKDEPAIKFVHDSDGNSETINYEELGNNAVSIANKLKKYSKAGAKVAVMLPPGKEYTYSIWGGIIAGTVMVPTLPPDPARFKQTLKHFRNILANSGAKIVITNRMIKKKMMPIMLLMPRTKFLAVEDLLETKGDIHNYIAPSVSDDSLALLQYTSGSSSDPKGVMTSYKNIYDSANLLLKKLSSDVSPRNSTVVSWLPPSHNTGLFVGTLLPIIHGGNCISISPMAFLARPILWLEEISKAPGEMVISGGPHFAYEICAKYYSKAPSRPKLDLSKWHVAFVGTEYINQKILNYFEDTFSPCGFKNEYFQPSYGLTEQVSVLSGIELNKRLLIIKLDKSELEQRVIKITESNDPLEMKSVVGCGSVLAEHTVKIINPDTLKECTKDQIGEIWISGSSVTLGYWKNTELTEKTFHGKLEGDENQYLKTGDLGFFYQGEIFIVGRHKDIIIIKGKNYYPVDIERMIEDNFTEVIKGTTIAFAADVDGTERLCIIAESLDKTEGIKLKIKQAVSLNNSVAPYQIILMDEGKLPRSALKKIRRGKIVEIYSKKAAKLNELSDKVPSPVPNKPKKGRAKKMSEIEEMIVSKVAKALAVEESSIDIDESFLKTGLDSLQLVELTFKISSDRQVRLPDDFAWRFETIKEAALFVSKQEPDETIRTELSDDGDTLANFGNWVASQIPQFVNIVSHQDGRDLIIDGKKVVDFASCNYLGYDFHPDIIASIPKAIEKWGVHPSWTRIVASPEIYYDLEESLKELIGAKHVVAFPTATLIHLGVLPVLCGDGGSIFIDSAAHTSIQEGAHLARAKGAEVYTFKHRSIEDLERLLKEHPKSRRKVIAIDGVYSMSGWWVDLKEYAALAKKYDAYLYVDDAHGFGIVGENPSEEHPLGQRGNGVVRYYDLDYTEDRIIYVSVLSKAYSSIGAFITACDEDMLKLIYNAPTMVFTGPIPTASLASALEGVKVNNREGDQLRTILWERTQQLVEGAKEIGFEVNNSTGFPIVFVVMGGVDNVIKGCQILWEHGVLITPAIFPGVPLDRGGIRFSLTTVNTVEQIEQALVGLREVYNELNNEENNILTKVSK